MPPAIRACFDQTAAASQVPAMAQQPLAEKRVDPWHQPILQHRLALMRLSATAAVATAAAATVAAAPASHLSSAARLASGPAQMVAAAQTGAVQGQSGGTVRCGLISPFPSLGT